MENMGNKVGNKKTFSPRNYPDTWERYQRASNKTIYWNRTKSKRKSSNSNSTLKNSWQYRAAPRILPASAPARSGFGLTQATQPLPQIHRMTGMVVSAGQPTQTLPKVESRPRRQRIFGQAAFFTKALTRPTAHPATAWLLLLTFAFLGRFSLAGLQSAYMDESNLILAGRYLIEHQTVYAGILNWAYGSYLWAIVAGLCAMAGGLEMVRAFTALCGVLMTVATGLFAVRLLPRLPDGSRRWRTAFLGALLMAFMPTALGLGRFGTYDSLAGAAFMGGLALLIPANWQNLAGRTRRFELLAAAFLLFVAFLAKYLDAVYFPFICLALVVLGYRTRTLRENLAWFAGPLTLGCLVYFLIFNRDLISLLEFSTTYSDLASPQPWREYVGERLEIWLLGALALAGWWFSRKNNRLAWVSLGGVLVLVAFQLFARPDYDFWKHSIYVIFFLAPLAGLALENGLGRLTRFFRPAGNRWGWRHLVVGVAVVFGGVALLGLSLNVSQRLVNFYPNLNPSLAAIRENTVRAKTVLTNDGALRFYLYPQISTDRVTDPFFFQYKGQEGAAAYKAAVSDRYFDTIVLDEGSGPQGQQLPEDLDPLLKTYYQQVYMNDAGNSIPLKIYRPRTGQITPPPSTTPAKPGVKVYSFESDTQGWGAMPENGNLQPGEHVQISQTRLYQGHPALQFRSGGNYTFLGVKENLAVRQVKMWVYIEPGGSGGSVAAVPVGMAGFDQSWNWHDDGFKQTVTPGQWTELTWNLPQASRFNQIGLKFAGQPLTAYLGRVEVTS